MSISSLFLASVQLERILSNSFFVSMRANFVSSPFANSQSVTAGRAWPSSCSDKHDLRANLGHCGMVPWLRNHVPGHFETHKTAERRTRRLNKISELVNGSLFYLEKLNSGVIHSYSRRCIDLVSTVDYAEICSGVSSKSSDLIKRLYEFWTSFNAKLVGASEGGTSAEGTLALLHHFKVGYGASTTSDGTAMRGDVVPADLSSLSLPSVDPVDITSLSPRVKRLLSSWESNMLVMERKESTKRTRAFEDSLFKTREGKLQLCAALYRAGMLTWTTRRRGPTVKCFTVLKKWDDSGAVPVMVQRLIMDLRGTNAEFLPPPYCGLANASNFSNLELSPDVLDGGRLVSWSGDVPDFFYRLRLPQMLCEYFCIGGITAAELAHYLGLEQPAPQLKHVALCCVAMGWSWAPYLAQCVAEDIVDECIQDSKFSRDYSFLQHAKVTPQFYFRGQPCAVLRGVVFVYIDDFGGWMIHQDQSAAHRGAQFSDSADLRPHSEVAQNCLDAQRDLDVARQALQSKGLGCHKTKIGLPEMLGYEVAEFPVLSSDGSVSYKYVLQGSSEKLLILVRVTIYVIQSGEVSAQTLSQIVGGFTWQMLVNRPLLSIFSAVYAFIHQNWYRRYAAIRIWPSVVSELECVLSCLPFFQADLSLPWGTTVYEVDAGPGMTAVCSTEATLEEVRELGRLAERGGWLIHEEESVSSVADAVERRMLRVSAPTPVDSSWFPKSRWQLLFSVTLCRREHNTISEVRAAVQAIKHYCGSRSRWHSRFAVLSDAGAAIGCLSKGRSGSSTCNNLCRQAAAMVFVANIRLYFRWVPSEFNNADGPSRGMRRPGVAPETASKGKRAFLALRAVWDACAGIIARSA